MELTATQQKYFAYWLTRSLPSDSLGKLTMSLQDAQVDLTPHQIDAALFVFKSPLSIKKIPKVLLYTCEFDYNDYSLNIVSVPDINDEKWEKSNT